MPALLVPANRRQVVTPPRIELRIFKCRTRSQNTGQASAHQLTGDRCFELIADSDLPASGQKPVHIGRSGMVRQAGHRCLVSLRKRQPEDLGRDDGVFAENLIEVT